MNPFWGLGSLYAVNVSQTDMLAAFQDVAIWKRPDTLICGSANYAAIEAMLKFQGRDRRRIKREVNKAMRKARRR